MTYLPFAILLGIISLKFIIESKNKSQTSQFTKIYLMTLLLGILLAPVPIIILMMFSPVLAWPIYSCWVKPNNHVLWRGAAIVFLIMSLKLPEYSWIKFGSSLDFIIGRVLTSMIIIMPLIIASYIESKYRIKKESSSSEFVIPKPDKKDL